MRIWVTGGQGSLGSCLVDALTEEFPNAQIAAPGSDVLDLLDREKVSKYVRDLRPTHVFHLAARVYGIEGHKEYPQRSLLENSAIDNNVFNALFEHPPQWIYYSSTVAAYGFPFITPLLEESEWNIGNPHESEYGYAMAKRHALAYLHTLGKVHNVKYVYGLTTNLFGSGDRFLEGRGHVVVSLLKKAKIANETDNPLVVWGKGEASRDFLSTKSASRILIDLIDKHLEVTNIASGSEISINRIADEISKAFNLNKGYIFTGENEGITRRICNIDKLKKYSPTAVRLDVWSEMKDLISESVKS